MIVKPIGAGVILLILGGFAFIGLGMGYRGLLQVDLFIQVLWVVLNAALLAIWVGWALFTYGMCNLLFLPFTWVFYGRPQRYTYR